MLQTIVAIALGVVLLTSFTTNSGLFNKPANFPAPVYDVKANDITEAGFTLGRKLFYDPILSADNTISCGSCHIQAAAFSHHGHDLSHGINDLLGTRNAPGLQNLAWFSSFMWDGGIRDLDLQPIAPITNPVEMGDTLSSVLQKLNRHPLYPSLFYRAFGSDSITTSSVMRALSQFMIMLVSADSKYDKVMRNEGAVFSPEEQQGYEVFKQKCASCHKEPLFTDMSFRNNGLALTTEPDDGRYLISLNETEKNKFKVPSLRNLKFTFPYMHDGRFYTIDEVLDHYSSGMVKTPNIDPLFITPNGSLGVSLSEQDKLHLKKFLLTLNDTSFVKNPRFDEPGSQLNVK